MRGFSKPKTTTVTIQRADESLDLPLVSAPLGLVDEFKAAWPEPADGAPDAEKAVRRDATVYFLLGIALGDELTTGRPSGQFSEPVLREYVGKVRDELRAANLTDAEVMQIAEAALALNQREKLEDGLGNSSSSSPPTGD